MWKDETSRKRKKNILEQITDRFFLFEAELSILKNHSEKSVTNISQTHDISKADFKNLMLNY